MSTTWLLCLSIAACCTSAHTTTTTVASDNSTCIQKSCTTTADCAASCHECLPGPQICAPRIDSTAPKELWHAVIAARNTYSNNPVSPLDLRVTPAHAYRGPGQVRISVISNASATPADKEFFTYNAPFQYRWTNKYLQSTLKPVRRDGTPTTFNINDVSFEVTVPAKGAGTLGLIFADPCFAGAAATCFWASKFQTFERMTELMNVVVPNVDYWQILGDNFYDRDGHLTQAWYDQLSLNVKSTLFATTAGNHDYWGFGSSIIGLDIDQFGNGLMQYYGMDTISSYQMSQNTSIPTGHFIDYSIDPDAKQTKHKLPPLENFFTWFAIGNVGYILYSGGYEYQDTKPYFEEACAWLKKEKPAVAFIAGHWNDAGLGCSRHMDVPAVYEEVRRGRGG